MIKWVSIFCSVMYVLATTSLAEVLKMPVFIEHAMEYQGSFAEFLLEHYDNHEEDEDWATDQQLPFINPPSVLMVHAQIPETIFHIEKLPEMVTSSKILIYHDKDFSGLYLSRIFQPPRFC